jgi:D-alanyl-D-alanine carboxypeptidase (penicillin-binding protein 5/6)
LRLKRARRNLSTYCADAERLLMVFSGKLRKIVAGAFGALLLIPVVARNADPARAPHRVRGKATQTRPSFPLNQIHVFDNLPAPFAVEGSSADLVALHSGTVLYAFNEHVKTQPASLAKMMTFYLALEALKQGRITLDTMMPVSEAAWRLSLNDTVSRMFVQVGQKVAVHDLLYGLMVSSGNDAAVVLAEYLSGSGTGFADEMNKKAAEIGMTETHFTNPDGLPTPGEYTTAADMVKLARVLLEEFPDAPKYTSTKIFTFNTVGPEGRPVTISQRNFNTLLFYDSRVNGIKTGHVDEAGYHLVASAHSDDIDLISAVFGTTSMEKRRVETEKLLEWAFQTFVTVKPDWRKTAPGSLRVYKGNVSEVPIAPQGGAAYFTVVRGQERHVKLSAVIGQKSLVAPLPKGTQVGELTVMLGDKPVESMPIVTQAAVDAGGFFHNLIDSVRMRL